MAKHAITATSSTMFFPFGQPPFEKLSRRQQLSELPSRRHAGRLYRLFPPDLLIPKPPRRDVQRRGSVPAKSGDSLPGRFTGSAAETLRSVHATKLMTPATTFCRSSCS
jgi:hypothetical protein